MRRPVYTVAVLVISLPVAAPAPALKDMKAPPIVGEWVVVRAVTRGSADSQLDGVRYVFTREGGWGVLRDGTEVGSPARNYATDAADPTAIDLVFQKDWGDGGRYLALFEVKGDRLTLCIATEKQPRPARLESDSGSPHTLIVFKRVRKKE
jgi:uncharacterized protein (TIGR03067 family)